MQTQVEKGVALHRLRSIRDSVSFWGTDYPDMYADGASEARRDAYATVRAIFGTNTEQAGEAEQAFRLTDFGTVYRPELSVFWTR